jgi:fatty-acyl-CoA synthase
MHLDIGYSGDEGYRMTAQRESILSSTRRIAKVMRRTGLLDEFRPLELMQTARVVAERGLGVRTLHTVNALICPDRPAIVDDTRAVTYAEAEAMINRISHAIVSTVTPESVAAAGKTGRVVLMMENRVEYVMAWFALFRIGTPAVHASYRSTVAELEYLVSHSGASLIIASEQTIETARGIKAAHPAVQVVSVDPTDHEDELDFHRWIDDAAATLPDRSLYKKASNNVVYTSGTTGKPKGAVRNFGGLGIKELSRILEHLPLTVGDRHMVVSPMYHSAAQAFVLLNTALRSTIYLRGHFSAADTLEAMSRWQINSVFMVPTMIRRLLDLAGDETPVALPDLRALISGAARFPHDLRVRAAERFGPKNLFDFYGSTEMGWVTLVNGIEMLARPQTVGRPLAGQHVAILDNDGQELAAKTVGTIFVANEQLMSGYLDDPAATEKSRRESWTTVDDLGYVDEDGYLYLSGRDRDMIISGGVNIYPVEIEDVLSAHDGIEEVAVVGVADEEWGERIVAYYVENAPLEAQDLDHFCREHLSSHKVPRTWNSVAELPRNPTGKVLKKDLREWALKQDNAQAEV